MRSEKKSTMRRQLLFADMEYDNLNQLIQLSYIQWFPPKAQLIKEGDPTDFLYIVTEGIIGLQSQYNQTKSILSLKYPMATISLATVLRDAEYMMSAHTTRSAQILLIPSDQIRMMISIDPAFARSIAMELAVSNCSMFKSLKNQKLRTSIERLANYIVRCHNKYGGDRKFRLEVNKRTLASLLGMTPENLSRSFGTLEKYGVSVNGRIITVDKVEDLNQIAHPTPFIDDW